MIPDDDLADDSVIPDDDDDPVISDVDAPVISDADAPMIPGTDAPMVPDTDSPMIKNVNDPMIPGDAVPRNEWQRSVMVGVLTTQVSSSEIRNGSLLG